MDAQQCIGEHLQKVFKLKLRPDAIYQNSRQLDQINLAPQTVKSKRLKNLIEVRVKDDEAMPHVDQISDAEKPGEARHSQK